MALLTFSGAQPDHFKVEEWLADHEQDDLGALAVFWYRTIRSLCPGMSELVHDGHPTGCLEEYPFVYVGLYKAHISLGFFYGAQLIDPQKLLEGTGRLGRHVKLRRDDHPEQEAITALIQHAYDDIQKRINND